MRLIFTLMHYAFILVYITITQHNNIPPPPHTRTVQYVELIVENGEPRVVLQLAHDLETRDLEGLSETDQKSVKSSFDTGYRGEVTVCMITDYSLHHH
jgi:hypothetical protein